MKSNFEIGINLFENCFNILKTWYKRETKTFLEPNVLWNSFKRNNAKATDLQDYTFLPPSRDFKVFHVFSLNFYQPPYNLEEFENLN